MTEEELTQALELAEAAREGDWWVLPSGRNLTLHVARGGVGLTVGKVERLQHSSGQLRARNTRDELYVVQLADVFACMVDSSEQKGRKAGFV
jgi:hypothetical protein